MGSLIVAVILGGIGTIFLGLINAWLRAELSAWFEPFVRWMISKGVARFPEEMRLSVQAEILDMNLAKASPTLRLLDACWFYAKAGRSVRTLQEVQRPAHHNTREFRRSMYRAMPWMFIAAVSSAATGLHDTYAILASAWQHPVFAITVIFSLLGEAVGGFMVWRSFRALWRVRRLFHALR
jgi:hypothetical protein